MVEFWKGVLDRYPEIWAIEDGVAETTRRLAASDQSAGAEFS